MASTSPGTLRPVVGEFTTTTGGRRHSVRRRPRPDGIWYGQTDCTFHAANLNVSGNHDAPARRLRRQRATTTSSGTAGAQAGLSLVLLRTAPQGAPVSATLRSFPGGRRPDGRASRLLCRRLSRSGRLAPPPGGPGSRRWGGASLHRAAPRTLPAPQTAPPRCRRLGRRHDDRPRPGPPIVEPALAADLGAVGVSSTVRPAASISAREAVGSGQFFWGGRRPSPRAIAACPRGSARPG